MTKSTTFRSWALAVLAALALGACNRDWDTDRAKLSGAGTEGSIPATVRDAMGIGMVPGAAGQGLQAGAAGIRTSFAALPDRGDLLGYPRDRVVRREGAYTWHRADVSEEHALRAIFDGELRITAPDGQILAFEYERHVEHPSGDWTWIGRLRDTAPGRQAILTFGARAVFGSIAQAVSEPLRLAMRDGASWLVETDPALLAGVEAQILRPEAPDFLVPPLYFGNPAVPTASGESETASASGESVASSSSTASSTTTVVDVLVGYTPGFATYHGGDSQARTRINFLVDVANQGYVNSQIDARVRLVHAMPVNYPDATDNGDTLEKMSGYKSGTGKTTPDPAFSELRNARETYGADLVTLIRKFNTPENDGCGIAWLIGGGLTTITQGYDYFGYSVVGDGIDQGTDGKNYFCREETMVHEFGHNMGSAHDRETAMGDDKILQTKEYGAYTYSFGYRTGPGFGDFYTIMAYREKRESGTQQQPYRVFSNPDITYCGGFACGASNADNARSLRQTMPVIAQFRAQVESEEEEVKSRGLAGDIDGDGKDDLLWFNPNTLELYYWLIDGGGIRLGNGGVFAPLNTTPRALADFNGDGRADILLASEQGIWIYFSNASGTFNSAYVSQYPAGWDLVGIHDVDADGKPDLIWHHPSTRELYYWLLDGATIRLGRGGVASPAQTAPGIIGDFNGDGRADLVLPSGRDIWIYLGNVSGSFTSVYLAPYPLGWDLVGAGDVNADGKDDLIWHHPGTGELYHWLMNEGAILAGNGGVQAPPNTSPRALGDFNADGRVDVLLPSDSNIWTYLATAGGSYVSVYTAPYPVGWY